MELHRIEVLDEHYCDKIGRIYRIDEENLVPVYPAKDVDGYYVLRLTGKVHRVHRLVAKALVGEISGKEVHHINQIKTDNRVENLQILSARQHAASHNHKKCKTEYYKLQGGRVWDPGLRERDVKDVKYMLAKGDSIEKIRNKTQVTKKMILLIKWRKIYRTVEY